MKVSYKLCSIVSVTALSMVLFNGVNKAVLAQFRGQDSQQFFDQGNQLMEQQIRELQQGNVESLEVEKKVEEENLESTLEIKKGDNISIQESPSPDTKMEDHVPESPNSEIEIQTN